MPTSTFLPNGGLKGPTRVLYLSGKAPDQDAQTIKQLAALGNELKVDTVNNRSDVLARINGGGNYHALLISHTLPTPETVGLITSLRQASVPIAIVPIVTESQPDLYASAAAVGADDTLILLGGTLLHPAETIVRAKLSRHVPAFVEPIASPAEAAPAVAPISAPPALVAHTRGTDSPTVRLAPPLASDSTVAAMASAVKAYDADRAAMAAERLEFQTRLVVLQQDAARAADLEAALNRATDEVRELTTAQAADRAAWETTRQDLERTLSEVEEMTRVGADLGAALAAAQAELKAAIEAHQSDAARLRQAHDKDRANWDAERREHLALVAQARDAAAEQLRESAAADRLEREQVRIGLERRVAELEAMTAAPGDLETAVNAARASAHAEMQSLHGTHAADRAAWDQRRERLEHELRAAADARSAADEAGAGRSALEARLADAASTEAGLTRALDQARGELAGLRSIVETLKAELQQARDRAPRDLGGDSALRAELDRLTASHEALEARLRQARRIEAAGRLAADVAPDLDAVASLVDACAAQFALAHGGAPDAALAERVRACASKSIPPLRQLLAFSRKQLRAERQMDLAAAVERAAQVLAPLVGSHIEFRAHPGATAAVWMAEEDLDQILTTLVVTGRDLLATGGSLIVETGAPAHDADGHGSAGRVEPCSMLKVIASGRGVQPAVALPSIADAIDRCGATLQMDGVPGRTAEYRVLFSRSGS